MSSNQSDEQVEVVLLGFDGQGGGAAEESLMRVFGVTREHASQLLQKTPTPVARNLSPVRAEYFRRALEQIGARVELRGLPSSGRPPTESGQPAAPPPVTGGPAVAQAAQAAGQPEAGRPPGAMPTPLPKASPAIERTLMQFSPESTNHPMAAGAPAQQEARGSGPRRTLAQGAAATARTLVASDSTPPRSRAAPTLLSDRPSPVESNAFHPLPAAYEEPLITQGDPSVVPMILDLPNLLDAGQPWPARDLLGHMSTHPPQSSGAVEDPQWGRLLGLSTKPPSPETARAAAKPEFTPPAIEISSGNVELEEGGVHLELDDPSAPRARPVDPVRPHKASLSAWPAPPSELPEAPAESTAPGLPKEPSEPSPPPNDAPSSPPHAARAPRARPNVGYQDLLAMDGPNIERSLWEAMSVAFTGRGMGWLAVVCVGFGLAALCLRAALVLPGLLALAANVFAGLSLLMLMGFTVEFFQHIFWASIRNRTALATGPRMKPRYVTSGYLRAGMHMTVLALVGLSPAVVYLLSALRSGATNAQVLGALPLRLLVAGALLYVPMCLTTATLGHRVGAAWAIGAGVRAILRAPLRYAFVALAAGLSVVLSGGCFAAIAAISEQSMWFLGAVGLPISAGTAIAAAMMGHLVRDRSDLFE